MLRNGLRRNWSAAGHDTIGFLSSLLLIYINSNSRKSLRFSISECRIDSHWMWVSKIYSQFEVTGGASTYMQTCSKELFKMNPANYIHPCASCLRLKDWWKLFMFALMSTGNISKRCYRCRHFYLLYIS